MQPVTQPTNTQWTKYQHRRHIKPSGATYFKVATVPCTFEEALDKAQKEREMIEANDKSFDWKSR